MTSATASLVFVNLGNAKVLEMMRKSKHFSRGYRQLFNQTFEMQCKTNLVVLLHSMNSVK